MRNNGYKIIILFVFISLFFSACPVENKNTDDDYSSGAFGDFLWYYRYGDMVISGYKGEGGDVTVPSKINGRPVEFIGSDAFRDCDNLESVILPNGILIIGQFAFYGCTALSSITIPDSVTEIHRDAFSLCKNLKSVNIPDSVIYIDRYTFSNSGIINITIPDSVLYIGDFAFSSSDLTNITISSSVTSIGNDAFTNCRNLDAINVNSGNTVYSSDDGILYSKDFSTLFVYPKSREGNAIIQESVTTVNTGAFITCHKLNSITIPDSVTNIGNFAFSGCSNLETINVSSGNTKYSSYDGILFNKDFSALIVCPGGKIGAVSIPDGVTRILFSAFSGCIGVTSITIPEGVTLIERNTFSSCVGLVSITMPDSVTSIGNGAFWRCSNLTNIIIPENITSIEDNAFLVCDSLASVTFAGNKISSEFFSYYSFNGDLRGKYLSRGIGTYIRLDAGYTWTKSE